MNIGKDMIQNFKTIFYKKQGRRYVPVSEYDNELTDAFPKGTHLVMCYPGGQSTRYNIDPNYAAMIAAGRIAEDWVDDKDNGENYPSEIIKQHFGVEQ